MKNVLDNGFVDLTASMADDLTVVNAARVSFATRKEVMDLSDEKLIQFLYRERHTSPFEHAVFRFHVRAPIFVVREWQRHRMASYNEQSGRYSTFEPVFYVPDYVRTQVGKPGAYTFEPMDVQNTADVKDVINIHNHMSYQMYVDLMEAGVAKEQARLVLPPTLYTEFWFTLNLHSLMNFLRLRNSEHAMYEIRQYAQAMEEYFAETMPVSYRAYERYSWHIIDEEEDIAA
jgi:thymidylate synthase (FAD)